MIEDFDDGSRGLLLDWEFAVKITKQGEYDLGGTVSVHALTIYPWPSDRAMSPSGLFVFIC